MRYFVLEQRVDIEKGGVAVAQNRGGPQDTDKGVWIWKRARGLPVSKKNIMYVRRPQRIPKNNKGRLQWQIQWW